MNPAFTVCPVKCRLRGDGEKKRVETFRNIRYGDGRYYQPRSGSPQLHTHSAMHHMVQLSKLSRDNAQHCK